MSLLSVIFALIAESFISSLAEIRQFDMFHRYEAWLRDKLPHFYFQNGTITLLIVITGVVFIVWLLSTMLGNVLGLFEFIFGVVVLVFSIGPRDLAEDGHKVINAFESADYEQANLHASDLLGYEVSLPPQELAQTVKESILLQANSQMLGVFFWFIFLGPVGAVLFRLSCILKEKNRSVTDDFAEASRELYRILVWLPARICVLSYAVAGSFVDTMSDWGSLSDFWQRDSEDFIIASGKGALRYDDRLHAEDGDEEPDINGIKLALALVKRAVIVWVVFLGLLTVTGWLF